MFLHPERLPIALTWLLIVVALLWRGYRHSPLAIGRRVAAILCKLAAAILLGLCLLDPVHTSELPKQGANEVIILADNSASLAIAERPGLPTRAQALQRALFEQTQAASADPAQRAAQAPDAPWLAELAKHFRLRFQLVDQRVHGLNSAADITFDGTASALCSAVQTARDRQSRAIAAVVVLSDGNATDPAAWLPATVAKDAPVFPVLIGEAAPARDLALTRVTSQQTPFEDAPVTLTAEVAATGFAGQAAVLTVSDEAGKEVARETHTFAPAEERFIYRPRLAWSKPGVAVFQVSIAPAKASSAATAKADAEATLANNSRTLIVDRGTGPYRVLYLAGRPNWEYKFLRRAIASDTQLQMPCIIRIAKREPKFEWRGRPGEATNPLFRGFGAKEGEEAQRYDQPVLTRLGTKDRQELSDGFPKSAELLMAEYHAIIIDDLEAEFFTHEQMNLIERFVSARGGSLLMLGGMETFAAGGYEATPVGRMLPVYLDKIGSAAPVEDARLSLTREGWLEPWTRLRADQPADEQRLAAMPTFYSVNQAFSIKPGASILANLTEPSARSFPALVTQRYGSGQVIAFTLGDVWRWSLHSPEGSKDVEKMWRQLLRRLVTDVPGPLQLSAALQQSSGQPHVPIEVRLRTPAWQPQDEASVQVEVTAPDGQKTSQPTEPGLKEPGLHTTDYYPRQAGAYRVTATAKDANGKLLDTTTTGWALNPLADELAQLAPNAALMQRLAKDSGGEMLALKDIAKLTELLPKLQAPIIEKKTTPLWHSPLFLAVLLSLLIGEWLLRRSNGVL